MQQRVRKLNHAAVNTEGRYILYWCRWNRRAESNHALALAAEMANQLNLPLVFFESLSCDYPHANDRLHTFVLEGVPETGMRLRKMGIGFVSHLARKRVDRSLDDPLGIMARGAAAVVTDDCMLPPPRLDVQVLAVDASCIVPMNCIAARSYAAYSIGPKIHKLLPQFLKPAPAVRVRKPCRESFAGLHTEVNAENVPQLVARCEIDHTVPPSLTFQGGRAWAIAGSRTLPGGKAAALLQSQE